MRYGLMTARRLPLRLILLILLPAFCLVAYYATRSRQDNSKVGMPIGGQQKASTDPDSFEWLEIFKDFYVYSVYPTVGSGDSAEIHATIIGNGGDRNFWRSTQCHCAYYSKDQTAARARVSGSIEELPESHLGEGHNMMAGRMRCPYPTEVQISDTKDSFVDLQCHYGQLSGVLTFRRPAVIKEAPASMSFAHCSAPIWGQYDQPAAMMEFIEYYRLMGIEKFFWYELDVSNRTQEVLKYYQRQGLLHLTKWQLPWPWHKGKSIHYFGQLAALYDCVMKTSGRYDYTVVSDLDEYFVQSTKATSFALIMKEGSSDCAVVRSVFMDPTANYGDAFNQQSGEPILRTATITRRTNNIFPTDTRSKYICRMRQVDVPMIHTIGRFRGNPVRDRPNPETTLILHFRSDGEKNLQSGVDETRGAALSTELQAKVSAAWREIFG